MRLAELLCSVGIHHAIWRAETVSRYSAEQWLQVRCCERCGRVIA